MRCILLVTAALFFFMSCTQEGTGIKIQWEENLQGDFSFSKQWSYAEGIWHNRFGQLVCNALCDDAISNMLDDEGRILEDSVSRYYSLVDTTHFYHTIVSDANCYEWAGTDYAHAYKNGDTVRCYTECNVATHSSLHLQFVKGECIPRINLNSITPSGEQDFNYKSGFIKVDKPLWLKGILKAEFDFVFDNPQDPKNLLWWKGRIYTTIKENP